MNQENKYHSSKDRLVVSVGRIIGENYIGIRNANGDVCSINSAEYPCKIHVHDLGKFICGLDSCINGEDIIEYRGLLIPKDKVDTLRESIYDLQEYVGKSTLKSILIS